ncbi:hypothetical protein EHS13_08725 [Paenibacillus psychroresistens]|uniref:Cthe-2314-like HEPN domain-containing protein n=1 Tax=Paenibacillus psychroresistens TaxID=1778678 RepID=A0A6B8RHY0_9BACL|nr:Cthe_2314 family HEPN domain-containing protein [Paenibacillus psychroresistens]QGQ94958.1 hypothetical protein EHS13_08725 [Paenibacillus psychroresistens]
MLRHLFGEPERQDSGLILKTNQVLGRYLNDLHDIESKGQSDLSKLRRWEIWVHSFITAVDELEQGVYSSLKYSEQVLNRNVEDMKSEEQTEYRRYLYYYKNSFIRVFAILDKLGFFLNERLHLNTEKVKPRFSYFTVIRQMHDRHIQTDLEQKLYNLKVKYSEPLNKLRDYRNVEIHSINYEAADDLLHSATVGAFSWNHIENLPGNNQILQKCFEMVCETIIAIYNAPCFTDGRA